MNTEKAKLQDNDLSLLPQFEEAFDVLSEEFDDYGSFTYQVRDGVLYCCDFPVENDDGTEDTIELHWGGWWFGADHLSAF